MPRRQVVLFLFPGPRWDISTEFTSRLNAIENVLDPVFFSSAEKDYDIHHAKGRVRAFCYLKNNGNRELRGISKILYYFRYLRNALAVSRELQREDGHIDAVVSYDALATGLVAWIIARRFKARLVCEVNGVIRDRALYKSGAGGEIKRWINWTFAKFILNRCDGIKLLYDSQLGDYRNERAQTLTLFDHVELVHFRKTPAISKVVLALGYPAYIKGFDILITAFRQILRTFPEWRLVIVGHLVDDLIFLAKFSKGCPSIEIRPAVYHREVPKVMEQSNIVVMPSRTEGMGRVLIEAMAAGRARIGANVGGIPTVIDDENDGLLFDACNTEDLAKALTKLMGDEQLRNRMAFAAHDRVHRDFNADRYAVQYGNFIHSISENR